jgi:outer membrane protein insertion porin family
LDSLSRGFRRQCALSEAISSYFLVEERVMSMQRDAVRTVRVPSRIGPIAAVLLVLVLRSPLAAQSDLPTRPAPILVADVRIVGNHATKEDVIRTQLRTRKDREFDPELVRGDINRLASTGRFQNVRTFTQETPEGVVVTFEVTEQPTIHYIRFLGNRGLSDKALLKITGLNVGDPMNRFAIEEARRKIEELYQSKGFPKTQVLIQEGDQPRDRGAVFAINEGNLERILDVKFIGNAIASDSRLKTQIRSKPGWFYLIGGKVDLRQIDEDIQRLTAYYRNLGFFSARIGRDLEFTESGNWVTITFVIDEGPRYVVRSVGIVGNQVFDTDGLLGRLELSSGNYFNLGQMQADVNKLQDIYGGQGYIFADIRADPRFLEEPGQLDLVYSIEEGRPWRAGRINVNIEGEHPHTRQTVVLNRLSVRPGDLIDIREVRASERRLKASQLFANDPMQGTPPQVRVRPPELADLADVIVEGQRAGPPAYRGQQPDEPDEPYVPFQR